jgi:dihydrofolate synthase / folylpolyglutamate synthase
MTFDNLESIKEFVYSRIIRDNVEKRYADNEINKILFTFFDKLDNPQQKIKVIHVAGTSGKGSTCNFISHVLASQGFKVGMTVSPYIENFKERIQINNKNQSDEKFIEYFNEIYQILFITEEENKIKLSTFEILTGLTFWSFWRESVDYAILEVGLGGLLDATNVPNSNKICVLNSIGIDHERFLGNSLELIAEQKAGIIQEGNLAVALSQSAKINKVFQENADNKKVELEFIFPDFDFNKPERKINKENNLPSLIFEYNDSELETHTLELNQIGDYQASNCALALRAVEIAADRDNWEVNWKKIADELKVTTFNARFQFYDLPNKNLLILDGAHNPQKMECFTLSLSKYFPKRKFNWVIGIKRDKGASQIIDQIITHKDNINKIILTEFEVGATKVADQVVVSKSANEILTYLESINFTNYEVNLDLANIVFNIKKSTEDYIITGSLYLVGNALNILNS